MGSERPLTRRALFVTGLGLLGSAVAGGLANVLPTSAASGDPVRLGRQNDADRATRISTTGDGTALQAVSDAGLAVGGRSLAGIGVKGDSEEGVGVIGRALTGDGVEGIAKTGRGVFGASDSGSGLSGYSRAGTGVTAYSERDVAVRVNSGNREAIHAYSLTGRGGVFEAGKAQIRLVPSSAPTHPAQGLAGDLFLDGAKRLWLCTGASDWNRIA